MKIMACYVLHYGAEWLEWSMRSVASCVDAIGIFYTPIPSFGHATELVCPETKDQIIAASSALPQSANVMWFDAKKRFAHEGEHRTWAVDECYRQGADAVLVVDADELWAADILADVLHEAIVGPATDYCVGMRHFWRSTRWVCDDAAMPTRIIKRSKSGQARSVGYASGKAYHMGYAQSSALIAYKQSIHGHKAEWRQRWFEDIFMSWEPGKCDVHPTNIDYWCPKRYVDDGLYALIQDHPYMGLELIP